MSGVRSEFTRWSPNQCLNSRTRDNLNSFVTREPVISCSQTKRNTTPYCLAYHHYSRIWLQLPPTLPPTLPTPPPPPPPPPPLRLLIFTYFTVVHQSAVINNKIDESAVRLSQSTAIRGQYEKRGGYRFIIIMHFTLELTTKWAGGCNFFATPLFIYCNKIFGLGADVTNF